MLGIEILVKNDPPTASLNSYLTIFYSGFFAKEKLKTRMAF
jgi:hypothetical protein